ncbi:MAG TPA: nitroreductase [Porticoccaceae bacterium]|nr:nitroreductase [Porticoccaceae bacterium]
MATRSFQPPWFALACVCFMLSLPDLSDQQLEPSTIMKALDALHSRISFPKLNDPIPEQEVLDNIYKSAFRAADHAVLRPWRFLVIKGESRARLGELFVSAASTDRPDITEAEKLKLRDKPLRAPLILVTVVSPREHPKVPACEQELSAAAATQNMLIAAYAQGVGAMWRTGSMAYHPLVMAGLGLDSHEKIIAFVYIGSINAAAKNLLEVDLKTRFKEW